MAWLLALALLGAPLPLGLAVATPDGAGIEVPQGRFGDVATYDRFEPDAQGDLEFVGTVRFQVMGPAEGFDERLELRPVVQVGVSRGGDTLDSLQAWHSVDLATRAVLQAGFVSRFEHGFRLFGGLGLQPSITPADDAAGFELPIIDPEPIVHAGRSYAPGHDLAAEGVRLAATWSLPAIAHFQATLGAAARLEAEVVHPLEMSGSVMPEHGPSEDTDGNGLRPFLTTRVPLGRESSFHRSVWLAPTQAYPLLVHDRFEGAEHAEVLHRLRAVEAGQVAFDWGTGQATTGPAAQVAGANALPADSATTACLQFEDLRARAEGDLRLASFQAWRRLHAGASLVGLGALCHGYAADTERQAFLSYADEGSGDGYTVWLRPDNEASWASSAGESFLGQYPAEAFLRPGQAQMGWGEAEAAWRRLTGLPVMEATWGIHSSAMAAEAFGEPATIGGHLGAPGTLVLRGWPAGDPQAQSSASFDAARGTVLGLHSLDWDVLDAWLLTVGGVTANVVEGAAGGDGLEGQAAVPAPAFPVRDVLPVVYGLGLLAVLGVLVKWLLPGFVRIAGSAALRHPTRAAMLDLVRAEPGIGLPRIGDLLGLPKGTAAHHAWVLQRAGLVASVRDGRHRHYFEAAGVPPTALRALALLRNERTRAVLVDILRRPGAFRQEMAQRMGLSAPAVGKHLKRLRAAGLVVTQPSGRRRVYQACIDPERHGPLLEATLSPRPR